MKSLFATSAITFLIHLPAVAQIAVTQPAITQPAVDQANPASLVDRFADLSAAEQTALSDSIQGKKWRRLSPEQRIELQKAAVSYSERVLGRDAQGDLKVVKNEAGKQLLKIAGDYLHKLSPGEVPAHAAAQALYGSIPAAAKRGTGVAEINPRRVRMHSTGFYAAPGEVVVVEVPEEWTQRGLKIWVSGHRDNIPLKKALLRTPRSPARQFSVDKASTEVAATYGGAVYIDTGNTPIDADPFLVNFQNALPAPMYVHGKTTLDDWQKTQRSHPAPYAELVGRNVAISFPSQWIRELDDPASLMDYWDGVVELHDQLGGYTELRKMPERVNVDCQISVGLFHAGYPTQGPQKQCRGVVDLPQLTSTGNWGWFHELGHEAQRRPDKAWSWNNPYTFDGSIEVTVNLFSAHAFDQLGMRERKGWTWTASAEAVEDKATSFLAQSKTYADGNAGEKLAMHLQIRHAYGWDVYREVLAGYSKLQDDDPSQLPKDGQAKRDAWLVRMSQSTGRNLAPFYGKIWGIPLSPSAIEKVGHLPAWSGGETEN
ncbi:M60 family metallopeptidase [Stieleria marina]